MAGRNVNKIKPWMVAKNTNEMVTSYVQNIYKQMPLSFNKGLKTCKVATFRPENRGPLSTWKHQQKQLPANSIAPKWIVAKKSNSKMKQQTNNAMKFDLAQSKPLLRTPNYKIYKSLRYGSSCSSSRSSIFKRFDERRRQRQSNVAQINYLIRSFHTSKFEPTYARFLMPARNQQLQTNLGSIPDAIKFSNKMLKDLMAVDRSTRDKIAQQVKTIINMEPSQRHNLDKWNHPPSLSKYKIKIPKAGATRNIKSIAEKSVSKALLSPETRDYARLNVGRASQLKPVQPANELFIPQHDRHKTELSEKHRRHRMKKLGLIKSPTASEKLIEAQSKSLKAVVPLNELTEPQKSPMATTNKKLPKLANQTESTMLPPLLIDRGCGLEETPFYSPQAIQENVTFNRTPDVKATAVLPTKIARNSCIPLAAKSNAAKATPNKYSSFINSTALPISYSTISPIVALRAQMPNKRDLGSYRYHRHDFYSTKKY